MVPSSTTIRPRTEKTILRVTLDLAEPEPAAVDRLDQPGITEFAAKRRDVHVQHLGRPVPVRVPRRLQDLLPAHNPAGIGRQALENVEFLRRELDLLAADGHP